MSPNTGGKQRPHATHVDNHHTPARAEQLPALASPSLLGSHFPGSLPFFLPGPVALGSLEEGKSPKVKGSGLVSLEVWLHPLDPESLDGGFK